MTGIYKVGSVWILALVLGLACIMPISADETATPPPLLAAETPADPTLAVTDAISPTQAASVTPAVTATLVDDSIGVEASPTSTDAQPAQATVVQTPTATPVLDEKPLQASPTVSITITPSPTTEPTATPDPTPAPTTAPSTPPANKAYLAILVSENVVAVNGQANGEVFISLKDIDPGVQAADIHLTFDPQIVQVVDADGNAANGIQVTAAPLFAGIQRIDANQADNSTGRITLSLREVGQAALGQTDSWKKVCVIAWRGRQEGNSVIAVDQATQFTTADGQRILPATISNGTVFVRTPGQVKGVVSLQGRTAYEGSVVTSTLAKARADQSQTDVHGQFAITVSYGEGFYTVFASREGYLSAESDKPIKLTVGKVVDLGEVVLYGGDVNNDNSIDIRDVSYIAWHFSEYDPLADVNDDGRVDILDLSLAAGNFGRKGPTAWRVPG
jgi:hypothetical protein